MTSPFFPSPAIMEERRANMVAWPCMSPGFMEQRTDACFCITCVPSERAGGTPDGEDSPAWVAAQAAQPQDGDKADDPVRKLSFEETPDKTVIPFKAGERDSGMTPSDCPGWMQTNYRVAMA